ncbi:hypothetical protein Tco_0655083 [Tanacetum coccineum]|uniref:Uncharacterized protein n=1 Tax=Tanacetum coccineum TaxID=301880 RepID=A0ABQ4X519_9ASTR
MATARESANLHPKHSQSLTCVDFGAVSSLEGPSPRRPLLLGGPFTLKAPHPRRPLLFGGPLLLQGSKPGLRQYSKPKGHNLSTYKREYDRVPRVLVTCRSILQLVILGVESRRAVPDWMSRLANDRVA